jgi:hypothetical protein
MVDKITLKTIKAGNVSATALNQNFAALVTAIDDTVSRQGLVPNEMDSPLDMNSNRIINLGEPVDDNDAARLTDVRNLIGTGTGDATKANTTLNNVLGVDFVNKVFQLRSEANANTARTLRLKLSETPSVLDWTGATFGDKLQNAINDVWAEGGGALFVPAGAYSVSTQITLRSKVSLVGAGKRATSITSTYNGDAFIIGDVTGGTKDLDISIGSMSIFHTAVNTYLFATQYVRGFRLFDFFSIGIDGFMKLGNSSLSTAAPTYIVEMYNGVEVQQTAASTIGAPFIDCRNFVGQYVADNAFITGGNGVGSSGFSTINNIQDRVDHLIVVGGYHSRFDYNWDFKNGRITNSYWSDLQCEGATNYAWRFQVDNTTAKTSGQLGAETILISNCSADGSVGGILINNTPGGVTAIAMDGIVINNMTMTGGSNPTGTAISITSGNQYGLIYGLIIDGVTGVVKPAVDNTIDAISITGTVDTFKIRDIIISNISLFGSGHTLRSGLKLAGSGLRRIYTSNINCFNSVVNGVDTSSLTDKGIVKRNGAFVFNNSTSFGLINNATTSAAVVVNAWGVVPGDLVVVSPTVNPAIGVTYRGIAGTDSVSLYAQNGSGGNLTLNTISLNVEVRSTT